MCKELGINDISDVVSGRDASLGVLSVLRVDNPLAFYMISSTAKEAYPDSLHRRVVGMRQAYFGGVACGVVGVAIARNQDNRAVSLGDYPVITEEDLVSYKRMIAHYAGMETSSVYEQFLTGFKAILPKACELVESYSMLGVNAYREHALSWMFGAVVSLGMARAAILGEESW